MATSLGDPHVKTGWVIATNKNAAERATTPGAVPPDPANPRAYLIVIRGRFVCRGCSRPPGANPPRGRVAYSIWVPGHGISDWGLQARPPRGLRELGRIVVLELASSRGTAPVRLERGTAAAAHDPDRARPNAPASPRDRAGPGA
jgi:hypothetical protein